MGDDYINKMWDRVIEENDVVRVETEKGRVYVDDPSEAPDDVQVQEGDQGGYFYETGQTSSDSGGRDGGGDQGGSFDETSSQSDDSANTESGGTNPTISELPDAGKAGALMDTLDTSELESIVVGVSGPDTAQELAGDAGELAHHIVDNTDDEHMQTMIDALSSDGGDGEQE